MELNSVEDKSICIVVVGMFHILVTYISKAIFLPLVHPIILE